MKKSMFQLAIITAMLISKQAKADYCYADDGYCNFGNGFVGCYGYDGSTFFEANYDLPSIMDWGARSNFEECSD